jgi:predicted HTH domain antitoxin
MTTKSLTLTIPDDLAQELDAFSGEMLAEVFSRGLRDWRIEKSLDRYTQGELSFEAAAELAGVGREDLARHAYARGIEPPFSPETLTEELA